MYLHFPTLDYLSNLEMLYCVFALAYFVFPVAYNQNLAEKLLIKKQFSPKN